MAYITGEQLTHYDDRIKNYIAQQIQNAVGGYSLQIAKLNKEIEDLTNTIQEQQDIINSLNDNINKEDTKETPMLRGSMIKSIEPETITVYEDIQEDYVVYDRVISPNDNATYRNIVVTSDNKSNRVWFSMWKTFDNRELATKEINVVWVNALGEKGESVCEDMGVSNNRLYFAWDIPIEATVKAGNITYAIRIVDGHINDYGEYVEDYAWHTLPATIQCVQGLINEGWDDIEEASATPGWLEYIEGKYKMSLVKISADDYEALTDKDEDTIYVVQDGNTITLYCGSIQISNN